MTVPVITPAACAFDAHGKPFSPSFGDVYHSADGAIGQARRVFLGGTDLPRRWRGRRHFTILETGFGFGVNFVAAWDAWRRDAERCGYLHFVSIERHPLDRASLAAGRPVYGDLDPLGDELRAKWPLPLPGLHRIELEEGRVLLTLALGDVADVLGGLRLQADAVFLDGFAPERNPGMWTPAVFRNIARKAAHGATLATWCAAGAVRRGLRDAGFEVESRPGFGAKREMTAASFAPRWKTRRVEPPGPRAWPERRAVVIGAGLAGAAVCERLAARGWSIDLVERHPGAAAEASGNPAGVFHPLVSSDDGILARLTRAGFLLAQDRWRALERSGHALRWSQCGALLLEVSRKPDHGALPRELGLPCDYAVFLDRAEAGERAGVPVGAGGLFFPAAGWIQPAALVEASLAACGPRLVRHFGREACALERGGDAWIVRDASGDPIAAAPVVVHAAAAGSIHWPGQKTLGTSRVRGVVSSLPAGAIEAPRSVVVGDGFVLPDIDGTVLCGSTFEREDAPLLPEAEAHRSNLARLGRMLVRPPAVDPAALSGRTAWRHVSPDRFPCIGALPGDPAQVRAGQSLQEVPRSEGLYGSFALGSRGLAWSALGGELLAAQIEGEPWPVASDLAEAVDPARFMLRAKRRGGPR